jgi:thiamine pyrophosphate-dependent acetolactate synthase large subunit-like protein
VAFTIVDYIARRLTQQLAATIVGLIRAARSPAILVGQEIQRYGLAEKVGNLIAKLGMPATAVLSKSAGCARPASRADGRGVGRRRPAAMKSGMA